MVHLYVAVTDRSWFETLSASSPHDEVNFWQPSGAREFRRIQSGELFLFKLHAPYNFIVGGGIFSNSSNVPLSFAWDAFGQKNGVASLAEMRVRMAHYRDDRSILDERHDPLVGCRIVTQPFFWMRELWIPVPTSWSPNIVTGKGYDAEHGEGLALWNEVESRRGISSGDLPAITTARRGTPTIITPRLGQGAFRLWVTDSYERRCAVTGEKTLPILDAAHIKAFAAGGEHDPANGLLLRTDIHRLFDLGYVTVSDDRRFEVSKRLKADFDNGKHYYDLHGAPVRAPRHGRDAPSIEALAWHRENRFLY